MFSLVPVVFVRSCFWQFGVQTVATAMNATGGVDTTPTSLWSLRSYNKIAVLKHFRILHAADAERFHDAFKTSS